MALFSKIDDKTLHVWAGIILSLGGGFLFYYFTPVMPIIACLVGLAFGTLVGVLKEVLWDKKLKKGTFSKLDIFSTFWGSLVGSVMLRVLIDVLEKNL